MSAPPVRPVWIGLDFSGSHLQWRDSRTATAVWIARIEENRHGPSLRDVRRVQDLPGGAPPFLRLVRFLQTSEFAVAGIDAPLAPPDGCFRGDRAELLAAIRSLPCGERPFATGGDLLRLLAPSLPPRGRHIHRATEQIWRRRGINVRSVLWNGPRGGASFAAASLTLVAACGLAVWPWAGPGQGRVLAETFPAAQLKTWQLPYFGYNGAGGEARTHRRTIIEAISERARLTVPARFVPLLESSADALDSVICALAARAVSTDALAEPPGPASGAEGWIAVHR